MKSYTLGGIFAVFLLAAVSAVAQLTSINIATNAQASAIQADLDLNWLVADNPSFTAGGLLFESISNPALGDFAVGNGALGSFYADVTFLGRDSLRPNHFGVSSELGGFGAADSITLFLDYTHADLPITKRITAATYTTADFWHYRDEPGYTGSYFQDDILSFRFWQYIDVDNNLQYTIGANDDRRTAAVDFNDGVFLIVTNTVGIALEDDPGAVPEPSTYALFGAAALIGIIALRRRKSSGGATPGVVS